MICGQGVFDFRDKKGLHKFTGLLKLGQETLFLTTWWEFSKLQSPGANIT